ncbi:MAG TPA: hypothetical protein DDY88_04615 [Actinobacteria bacterium]|nr:hypothetical protein [Actinomycetota bacterium]
MRIATNCNGGGLLPQKISFKPGLTPNGNPVICTWYMVAKGSELIADPKATCGGTIVDTATGKVVFQG